MGTRSLASEKLAFFGTITASFSHEIKNVLATINEFSGLIADLVSVAEKGGELKQEKFRTISEKISHQLIRAEELILRLNRFSHSVDSLTESIDVTSLLNDICAMSNRFAKLKKVKLSTSFPNETLSLTGNAFVFYHSIFLGIGIVLGVASQKREINVLSEKSKEGFIVKIISADPLEEKELKTEQGQMIGYLVEQLGGHVKWLKDNDGDCILLEFFEKPRITA